MEGTQVRAFEAENRRARAALGRHDRFRGLLACVFAEASLAAWALYGALGLGRAQVVVAAAAAGVAFVGSSVPLWSRVLAIERSARGP